MTVATALVAGVDATPQLAEEAVRVALEKLEGQHPRAALVFLSEEFNRNAREALRSVSRITATTQIAGAVAMGVCTEEGWVVDRPAVAILLLCGDDGLAPTGTGLHLSLAGTAHLLSDWQSGPPRFGGCFSRLGGGFAHRQAPPATPVWSHGRLASDGRAEVCFPGMDIDWGVSLGLELLGSSSLVTGVEGYDLHTLGQRPALEVLKEVLPDDLRQRSPLPLHQLVAVIADGNPEEALAAGRARIVPVLAGNLDRSLTLARRVTPGAQITWGLRQPSGAQHEMSATLARLRQKAPHPEFGLMFSCIGRGPYFYGSDDLDLRAFRDAYPGMPLIGAYGSGQLVPTPNGGARLLNNSVLAAVASRHAAAS
ncbi:hypothetical protein OTERR_19480 [Oryzomicrobium terrae]|uniref:FIST C-domain domain-containing protein n=1 Tax=Oryzomicrobium terrae TaxID=1735038 RepID=A0A5C1E9U9_9RHOO|nr:FIST C-terminal domain-containing protein [Oryzomicrobium terrae]QEL65424.1 hypothetical protein OTERR_19480 [Oryzomicrobium terrae]